MIWLYYIVGLHRGWNEDSIQLLFLFRNGVIPNAFFIVHQILWEEFQIQRRKRYNKYWINYYHYYYYERREQVWLIGRDDLITFSSIFTWVIAWRTASPASLSNTWIDWVSKNSLERLWANTMVQAPARIEHPILFLARSNLDRIW